MVYLLHIETSGKICSVSLSEKEKLLSVKEDDAAYSHATKLAIFIESILKENGMQVKDLSAVSVSCGPGSYTGLRIGSSLAKGLCYGMPHIKLLAIPTLEIITNAFLSEFSSPEATRFCPMIDARRMEVYTALFDGKANQIMPTCAMIIDENSFQDVLQEHKVAFFGDGAKKCNEVINHPNAIFYDVKYASADMIKLSFKAHKEKKFVDVAYFEPFYLKDFIAGKAGKTALQKLLK